MAPVLKGSQSFTCTPTRSSAIAMSHTCLCLPSYSWYSFTDPGGMEGWVGLGGSLRSETVYLPIPVLTGLSVEQLRWLRPTRYRYAKPPAPERSSIQGATEVPAGAGSGARAVAGFNKRGGAAARAGGVSVRSMVQHDDGCVQSL